MNREAKLPDLLAALRTRLHEGDEAPIGELEEQLQRVFDLGDPACIAPLLLMLRDDTEPFHFIWSVIHTVEAFPESDYLHQLLIALPELNAQAPELAENLHTRILNDELSTAVYAECLQKAGMETRDAAREVLARITVSSPQLGERIDRVLQGI